MTRPRTTLLVDGENIDATLGSSILGRRPAPDERPRWDRVTAYAEQAFGAEVLALFFIAVHDHNLPMSFVQALMALGYRPIPLTGPPDVKVVDVAINRTLEALLDRDDDVILASHDGDFLPGIAELLHHGRRVGVMGFREFFNAGFADLRGEGLELFDLEDEVDAFTLRLPRMRIISIDEFDPARILD